MDKLGFDKAVNELSFAEKRLLIIISLTQQLEESAGDWGRTLESPANQLRILNEQWTRLGRAVGNLFLPILAEVLPYLNAILMVLTEIINSIATLLGFSLEDYDYFGSSVGSAWDFDDALQSAGKSAKKLKQGLRSFDKLNVITTPKDSSSGAGTGTGINPKLMEAFNKAFDSYQDKLDDVQMKATKIRDAIMEWLGFEKDIDETTGKVIFKYKGIRTTLKNIWDSFKKLNPLVKVLVGYLTAIVALKIFSGLKKIIDLLKATKLGKLLSSFNVELKNMSSNIKTANGDLIQGIDAWNKSASGADKFITALGGLTFAVTGLAVVKTSIDDINESGLGLLNTLGLVGGSLSTVFGGAMIGASIGGGWGALIGGIAGGLAVLIDVLINYKTEGEKAVEATDKIYEEHKKYNDEIRKNLELIDKQAQVAITQTSYHENLVKELESITDANGKVKEGYESRAKFILTTLNQAYGTEMQMINGTIQGYQKQIESIKQLIDTKKAEIVLKANEEKYAYALENQLTAYNSMKESEEALNKTTAERNDLLKKQSEWESQKIALTYASAEALERGNLNQVAHFAIMIKQGDEAYRQMGNNIKNLNKQIENQKKTYEDDAKIFKELTETKINYEELMEASISGNTEKMEKAIKEFTNVVKTNNGEIKYSDEEMLSFYKDEANIIKGIYKEKGDEINEIVEEKANARYNTLKESLAEMLTETKNLTDDMLWAWIELGEESTEGFMREFKELPDELTQGQLLAEIYKAGVSLTSEVQKALDDYNPKFKFDADLTKAYSAVNSFTSSIGKIKYKVDTDSSGNVTVKKYANGGLPAVGQMFIANERGPELVGNIGGQSFVANQNQMMDLLDKKIGNAQGAKSTQIFNIYLDEDHKIGTYTLDQLQDMAKSNGKAITIGG